VADVTDLAGTTAGSSPVLVTERLRLRPWSPDDAAAALALYGDPHLVRWLSPAMTVVADVPAMAGILEQWAAEDARLTWPAGRWAVEALDDGRLVGGVALLPLPPGDEDLELSYQVLQGEQGKGFATEAARRAVRRAFDEGVPELFVVSRPANAAGTAVAKRLGFQWVGETSKYYDLRLQIYRLRPADLTG
jgi:RimJ/RimL family protein N-acetyltransferase